MRFMKQFLVGLHSHKGLNRGRCCGMSGTSERGPKATADGNPGRGKGGPMTKEHGQINQHHGDL